jgi:CheY-like chemotaxis protein
VRKAGVASISQGVNIVDRREPAPAGVSTVGASNDTHDRRDAGDVPESFLRLMGHELRTPLQTLSMLVDLMRREAEKGRPSSSSIFTKAKLQLDRLSSLATDLAEAKSVLAVPPPEPLAVSERRQAQRYSQPEGAGHGDATREERSRILIADDDPSILETLGDLLRDRYEVLVAGNGEEVMEQLGSSPVDLVVLDMVMPRLDGEGALREIRGRGLRVPVIIVSARSDRLNNYRELGADDFIQKPFEISVLEEKIDRLLAA